jgi:signal transduction histidine kinase
VNQNEFHIIDALGHVAAERPALSLRFKNPVLEHSYLQGEYERNRRWIIGSLLLGLGMTLAFLWLDPLFIREPGLSGVTAIRTWVLAPVALIAAIGVMLVRQATIAIPWLFGTISIYGMAWTGIGLYAGAAGAAYVDFGVAQTILFTFICLALPFRWSATAVTLTLLPVLVLAERQSEHHTQFWHTTASLATVTLIATYGTFRYEWIARERFLAQQRFELEYARRLTSERDRSEWLAAIAGFMRHEMKNAMAGIGSSLELMRRTSIAADQIEYVDRAQRSLQFMRNLLQQVAGATRMEEALEMQEVEPVDLSRLVVATVEELRLEDSAMRVEVTSETNLQVQGNPDSLVQLLEKLLNNAAEHSEPAGTIHVGLTAAGGYAILEVVDYGDALPADRERIFAPFVSTHPTVQDGNLGLGLYVAAVIARHHGGRIWAEPTHARQGARFVVELPMIVNRPAGS